MVNLTEHISTKHKLQDVGSLSLFEQILAQTTLNDEEKHFLRMYYIEKRDLRFIADSIGMTEKTASRYHRKILRTIAKII